MGTLRESIDAELLAAEELAAKGDLESAFHSLERAHVLGQTNTIQHTRVHWLMMKIGIEKRDWREIFGQMFRLVWASTKTPLGIYPKGNTGGANVSPFRPMPIPDDLQEIIDKGN